MISFCGRTPMYVFINDARNKSGEDGLTIKHGQAEGLLIGQEVFITEKPDDPEGVNRPYLSIHIDAREVVKRAKALGATKVICRTDLRIIEGLMVRDPDDPGPGGM